MILGEFLYRDEALQKFLLRATHPRGILQGPAAKKDLGLELGSLPIVPGSPRVGLADSKHKTVELLLDFKCLGEFELKGIPC